jgi:uncharacterized protein (DUF2236 family)
MARSRASLSPEDLDRLRAATGRRAIDPARSLFARGSATWRVNQEAVVFLGGGRALLLQVAHPLVAAGVARHSDFRKNPLGRLWRTVDLVLTIVFAGAARAMRAVHDIERVHARVHGVLQADVGPFRRGTRYSAGDPELVFWVHATLVDTALLTYERFFAPLAAEARDAYYADSRVVARLLGVPDAVIPRTLGEFRAWFAGTVAGPTLTIGHAAEEIAASVIRPPMPLPLRPLVGLTRFVTAGLLPPPLRERYGLAWSSSRDTLLGAVAAASRGVVPHLPACLRLVPHARRAAAGGRRRARDRDHFARRPAPAV